MCTYPIPTDPDAEVQRIVEHRQHERTPEYQLSAHLAENFAVTIDPGALKRFICENWSTLSRLAHRIHDRRQA